jgi:probable rRNA maturation factor
MTVEIAISNRQRRHAVDRIWLEAMAAKIVDALCSNLRRRPAEYLQNSFIDEFERRGQLSLILVSDRQIRKLNREWREKDMATDVLSFPLQMDPPPAELPWEIGEIVISVERASEQAQNYGHDLSRELAFLFAHGLLHVLGFDHETPDDEQEMFGRQHEILETAGYPR